VTTVRKRRRGWRNGQTSGHFDAPLPWFGSNALLLEPRFKVGRNMTRQIHCVMKKANDLDHLPGSRAIHDEMPPAPTFALDMERPKVGENFVTGDGAE